MNLPDQLTVPDLLRHITDMASQVSIRLAVTWDKNAGQWVGRNLLVDVFPGDWLEDSGRPKRRCFSDYALPRTPPLLFTDRAVFLRNTVRTSFIKEWLTHPEDCRLDHYDPEPSQRSKVLRFSLPEFMPEPHGQRLNSKTSDNYAMLPWPHNNYYFNLKAGSPYYREDSQPLYKPNQHYEDLRDACGQLIHDFDKARYPWPQYNYQHEITVRVVDDDGWIKGIREDSDYRGSVIVSVAGRAVDPGHLILKRNDGQDMDREFRGPSEVTFEVPSGNPRLRFILGNARRSLDEAWYSSNQGPVLAGSQEVKTISKEGPIERTYVPHIVPIGRHPSVIHPGSFLVSDDPAPPAKKTEAKSTGQRSRKLTVLNVFVASPGDVQRERNSVPRVLEEMNRGLARELGLHLEPKMWETHAVPGLHKQGPQAQIEETLDLDAADIVIGIFWWRFGSPVSGAKSGTERELMRAVESWRETERPHVLVYFSSKPYMPKSKHELEQRGSVLEFQEKFSDIGLWKSYTSSTKFAETLRADLEQLLQMQYGKRHRRR